MGRKADENIHSNQLLQASKEDLALGNALNLGIVEGVNISFSEFIEYLREDERFARETKAFFTPEKKRKSSPDQKLQRTPAGVTDAVLRLTEHMPDLGFSGVIRLIEEHKDLHIKVTSHPEMEDNQSAVVIGPPGSRPRSARNSLIVIPRVKPERHIGLYQFVLLHELGHLELHYDPAERLKGMSWVTMLPRQEHEADDFALEILIEKPGWSPTYYTGDELGAVLSQYSRAGGAPITQERVSKIEARMREAGAQMPQGGRLSELSVRLYDSQGRTIEVGKCIVHDISSRGIGLKFAYPVQGLFTLRNHHHIPPYRLIRRPYILPGSCCRWWYGYHSCPGRNLD